MYYYVIGHTDKYNYVIAYSKTRAIAECVKTAMCETADFQPYANTRCVSVEDVQAYGKQAIICSLTLNIKYP